MVNLYDSITPELKAKIKAKKDDLTADIEDILITLDQLYDETMLLTEDHFPRVYNLRGAIMATKSIYTELKKGINYEFVDMGYFSEKISMLESDLEGFTRSYTEMRDGKYRRDFND